MSTITYAQALAELEAIVAEKGDDFVYEEPTIYDDDEDLDVPVGCVYFDPNTKAPSCGVGVWAAKHNITGEVVFDLSINNDTAAANFLRELEHRGYLEHVEDKALLLLTRFQALQDDKVQYREALDQAVVDTHSGAYRVVHGATVLDTSVQKVTVEA